jgi:hypothetical protein
MRESPTPSVVNPIKSKKWQTRLLRPRQIGDSNRALNIFRPHEYRTALSPSGGLPVHPSSRVSWPPKFDEFIWERRTQLWQQKRSPTVE